VILTNVGQLLERRGKEFLGSKYKDPISSFSDFQKFSVSNPEVVGISYERLSSCITFKFCMNLEGKLFLISGFLSFVC
jgi:hypothetical protein